MCRDTINRVALRAADGAWPELWARAGGEAPQASLRIADGEHWEAILHVFSACGDEDARCCVVQHDDGVLALLKPLLGSVVVSKLRPDGEVLGKPRTLEGAKAAGTLGGGAAADAYLQLGGPRHEYRASTSTAAVLELVLRHDTQPSSTDAAMPPLLPPDADAPPLLLDAFDDVEAPAAAAADAAPAVDATADAGDAAAAAKRKGALAAALASNVGGLESQLEAIVRRVLASRADPAAARRLGVSHVRGILLSGPPGCGKTLLARELSRSLGAREPQIVNGPEIIDKFVGEAEKKVRELFAPAEAEWAAAGDASELHVIILDEMDAIARKRGALSGDTTGVRDSVVNQLLAKMDGVVEAGNVLVVGLTNRPELIDPALLRPGRLEVHLEVALPDAVGRRDILSIHTRAMRANGALAADGAAYCDDVDGGLPARTEHFSGAELAGLVRSAASFALGRTAIGGDDALPPSVAREDFERARAEISPALGKQDEALARRFGRHGVASDAHASVRRALFERVVAAGAAAPAAAVRSALLAGDVDGAGCTALASWAAAIASSGGHADYVRMTTAVDLLRDGGSEAARATALADRFAEARGMGRALLVLDDVDELCAADSGKGGGAGPSALMVATLRALLREPLDEAGTGGADSSLLVLATLSGDGAPALRRCFDEVLAVPALTSAAEAADALRRAKAVDDGAVDALAAAAVADAGGRIGVKGLLRAAERAAAAGAAAAADVLPLVDAVG